MKEARMWRVGGGKVAESNRVDESERSMLPIEVVPSEKKVCQEFHFVYRSSCIRGAGWRQDRV
jgi:hypothetical protein